MIFYWLTDSEGDAGEGGGGVDGAAEQGLDVVSLGGVLAPAEVGAGLQSVISEPDISHLPPVSHLRYSLVQAAGQVVPAPRHAAHNVREVRLALSRVCVWGK